MGIVSHDRGQPVPPGELDELVGAYAELRGSEAIRRASAGAWAEVAVVDGLVPGALHAQDGSWLAATGAIHADVPLARATARDLDGQFAAVRYDAVGDVLEVLADPFGMQTLYVAERDGRTYLSTSSTVLARHLGAAPDPLGARIFLRAGYLFGPITQWAGVERLGPAVSVAFSSRGRARDTYWMPQVDERIRGLSLRRTVDECVEAGLSVAARRLRGHPRVWADLTGGFDSRLIAGLLTEVGVPFLTSTSGGDENPDVVLARQVARVGGYAWRHERLADDWQASTELADRAVAWSDGNLALFQLAQVLAGNDAKRAECAVVVTGGGGEHVSARPWVHELWKAGRTTDVDLGAVLRMRYLHPIDLSVLREDPGPEVEAYFRRELGARAELYPGELNTTKLDAIYAYKSTGHFGAYRSASETSVAQEIPFYFRDFFTVCFSAHHRWRNGHRLQREIIERLDPRTAALPTTMGGPAQPLRLRNVHRFAPYYGRAARATARKIQERLRPPAAGSPDPEIARRRALVLDALREGGVLEVSTMRSRELYDERALGELLAWTRRPNFSSWALLERIATLELALRAAAGDTGARQLAGVQGAAR